MKTSKNEEIIFVEERTDFLTIVISATAARKLVRKGCEAYLVHVVDTRKARSSLHDILTASDFPDVFSKELPSLPPERNVKFTIKVLSGTAQISIAPYRMVPT